MLDKQKEFYDTKAHGKSFDLGDLPWLYTTVRPQGVVGKFHQPWTRPFPVIKHLVESIDYKMFATVPTDQWYTLIASNGEMVSRQYSFTSSAEACT